MNTEVEEIEQITLDSDNVSLIVSMIRNAVFSLPVELGEPFEKYTAECVVNNFELNEEDKEFWTLFVIGCIKNKQKSLESLHNSWISTLTENGWRWFPQYNFEKKGCPLLITFDMLSTENIAVVRLFTGITFALAMEEDEPDDTDDVE